MTDSNEPPQPPRLSADAHRSIFEWLPGIVLNAPRRNTIIVLLYVFGLLLVAGVLWARL